ncbi:MAG: hypothetical protein RBT45_08545 [Acholeplasmataceae bacterium]|jgi:hypothetical protein|nr:hypothetical protein [Acholeplasmataceae bacterium]
MSKEQKELNLGNKNDISESQLKRGIDLTEKYKHLIEQETILKNLIARIRIELVEILQLTQEQRLNGVKLVERKTLEKLSIDNLKKVFNENYGVLNGDDLKDRSLIDSLMVTVDLEKTLDNLRYLNGIQEPLVRQISYKLEGLVIKTDLDLEVLK